MRKPKQAASATGDQPPGTGTSEKTAPREIDPLLAKREADLNALLEKKMEEFDTYIDGNRVAQRFLEHVRKTARDTPTVTKIELFSRSLTGKDFIQLRFPPQRLYFLAE